VWDSKDVLRPVRLRVAMNLMDREGMAAWLDSSARIADSDEECDQPLSVMQMAVVTSAALPPFVLADENPQRYSS
jgi:hypothetical protein